MKRVADQTGLGTKAPTAVFAAAVLAVLCGSLAAASSAQAQQVYRIVGPDGRVTFSDKPPANTTDNATVSTSGAAAAAGGASLPFVLQQVTSRYPVTLYTGAGCQPCVDGRGLLMRRGIPFTEKTITSAEDGEALRRLSGNTSLPFLTIGAQQIRGFSDVEWTQFLDAAGYPKTSQLPGGYRNPPATALVTVQRPDPARPADQAEAGAAAPGGAPAGGTPPANVGAPAAVSNPAGIRF